MIISHSRKFVFVSTPKTGSTSLEIELSRLCESGDIVTTLKEDNEHARPWLKVKPENRVMIDLDGRARRLSHHAPISAAFDIFGEDILDYRIISSERNPFDRMVSYYFWRALSSGYFKSTLNPKKHQKAALLEDRDAFRKFLLGKPDSPKEGYGLYSLAGFNVADFIVRHEHFTDDLQALAVLLGAEGKLNPGTRMKSALRPEQSRDKTVVARLFDGIEDMVRTRYARTFAAMGYGGIGSDCPEFAPWRNRQDVKRQYVERFKGSPLAIGWRRTFRMKHPRAFAAAAAIRQWAPW